MEESKKFTKVIDGAGESLARLVLLAKHVRDGIETDDLHGIGCREVDAILYVDRKQRDEQV